MPREKRLQIKVSGIVQGIGFRPYIYRLAKRLNLYGFVINDSNGVLIEIEGAKDYLNQFLEILQHQPPPLAQYTNIQSEIIPETGDSDFIIRASKNHDHKRTLISPDIATCIDCLRELNDPSDRRFQYPFINCTNCGPRYTIISDIPYDRQKTSMSAFKMCPHCQSEYDDPSNRRFHAQPNACDVCGPRIRLVDHTGRVTGNNPINETIDALKQGQILAIKGLGGFHLAVDATNSKAVERLRERKRRFEKPLALMVKTKDIARQYVALDEAEIIILESLARPIVLSRKKKNNTLSREISPDNDFYGIMLPYTPLHDLLFQDGQLDVLVMTSANISEEPICFDNNECLERMKGIADAYLLHNRQIYIRCDDSVVQMDDKTPVFIRRSRGYAPRPILLKSVGRSILAVGAQLKNTICLTRDNFAFMSQHIGDLENLETLQVFDKSITHIKTLFEINPESVIFDPHPEYLSTKWVEENSQLPAYPVQHHYAHILSVMAENDLKEDLLGFSMDGTGYGSDGTIWGGEVLLCNTTKFSRLAHFDNVPMPGGEKAIIEPWRMAVAYLNKFLNDGENLAHEFFSEKSTEIDLILKMIEQQLNSPQTSSCGRLFDTIAALLGLRMEVAYEGQAAIILEAAANQASKKNIHLGGFELVRENGVIKIIPNELIQKLVKLKKEGESVAEISWAFHQSLIDLFLSLALQMRKEHDLNKIAVSGGCFQNLLIRSGLIKCLKENEFEVYTNVEVPPNDGGLALGQAYWGMLNT
jgi:hydrogenase maturation protein HypF